MVIIIDSREQAPFTFTDLGLPGGPPATERRGLPTGDYSIAGLEDQITVERKSLVDLFGSCGAGRARFEREIERMATYRHAAIVCEADWQTIIRCPPARCKLSPKSVFASIVAWSQRYGVHFWPCVNRAFAEKVTYRILERFWRDYLDGKNGGNGESKN
jgi:ERCC4-type nuclease